MGRVDRMREPDLPAPSLPGGGGKSTHNILLIDPKMPLEILRKFLLHAFVFCGLIARCFARAGGSEPGHSRQSGGRAMANILGGEWEGGGSRGVIAPQLYELHPGVSVPCVPNNRLALLHLCVLSLS